MEKVWKRFALAIQIPLASALFREDTVHFPETIIAFKLSLVSLPLLLPSSSLLAQKKRTNKLILGKQSTNCVTRFPWVILTKLLKELTRISLKSCSFFVTSSQQFFCTLRCPRLEVFSFFKRRRFKFPNSFLENLDSSLVQTLRQRNFSEKFRFCLNIHDLIKPSDGWTTGESMGFENLKTLLDASTNEADNKLIMIHSCRHITMTLKITEKFETLYPRRDLITSKLFPLCGARRKNKSAGKNLKFDLESLMHENMFISYLFYVITLVRHQTRSELVEVSKWN